MSYCQSGTLPTKWISGYRWQNLFNVFPTIFIIIDLSSAEVAALNSEIVPVYYISGHVNVDGTGVLDPILVQPGMPSQEIPSGDYAVEVLDAHGNVLATLPFFASFIDVEGEPRDTVFFNFQIPQQTGASSIRLKLGDQILDEISVSANAPTVTVVKPNGGEEWRSGPETIEWLASDADNDQLSFTILYTPDDGSSWFPVASQLSGNSYTVDTSILPGGEKAKIRVIATDGFNNAQDDSDDAFMLAGKAPQVEIMSPSQDAKFTPGETIMFDGNAFDLEDESLPESSFFWSFESPESTVFGTGRQVQAVLPDGLHTVTLMVMDSDGNVGEASVTVEVVDDEPPVVTPPPDQVVDATGPDGAVVSYPDATAIDNVDGPLTPTCAPASGSLFPLGTTVVECTATDAAGNTGSASFNVTVLACGAPAESFNLIMGTSRNDRLRGTNDADLIFGLAGKDDIQGNGGDDCIFGGDGKDKIKGKKGHDEISGDAGDDEISGGQGNDMISGGDGDDEIKGKHGNDVLNGDAGNDEISGGKGDDNIDGGTGMNECSGGPGTNIIVNCGSTMAVEEEEVEEESERDDE